MIPDGLRARIDIGSWPVLPIFSLIQGTGSISRENMFSTFNMGIGMVLAVDPAEADDVAAYLETLGEKAYIIGEIISGDKGVELYEPGKEAEECKPEGEVPECAPEGERPEYGQIANNPESMPWEGSPL
jgi:hypothetical protein